MTVTKMHIVKKQTDIKVLFAEFILDSYLGESLCVLCCYGRWICFVMLLNCLESWCAVSDERSTDICVVLSSL